MSQLYLIVLEIPWPDYIYIYIYIQYMCVCVMGAKGDWDFWISDLWKPWWNWYSTPVVNFGEVRRAHLAKFTLITSTLRPCDLFRSFKVCPDAKDRVGCGKQHRTYSIPGKTAALALDFAVEDLPSAELQPKFLRLQWRTCPWAEHSDDADHIY